MTREGSEWVGRSISAADGNIEVRIHEVANPDPFQTLVAGTLRGSAVDKNTLGGNFPALTMSFVGPGGLGAAQISGKHAASIEISFGIESFVGTATVINHRGDKAVCTSLWEWSIQPGT